MNKCILAIVVISATIFADEKKEVVSTDATVVKTKKEVVEQKAKFTPVLKSEFLITSGLSDGDRPVILFGDNFFGVTFIKGDVEVGGVANVVDYPEYGFGIERVYVKKGIGLSGLDVTAGYKDLPFGHWTSNSVNFPLVRSGNYDPAYDSYIVKTKASQLELGFDNGVIVADVAGYVGTSGDATSIAAKVGVDWTIIAPNISVRADGMDTVDLAFGVDIDLGSVGIYGTYTRGVNVDRMGSYIEVSVFPTDVIIVSGRADLLANTETNDGVSRFSLSTLYLINDNMYTGIEYDVQSNVVGSVLQTPTHSIIALIGYEF